MFNREVTLSAGRANHHTETLIRTGGMGVIMEISVEGMYTRLQIGLNRKIGSAVSKC